MHDGRETSTLSTTFFSASYELILGLMESVAIDVGNVLSHTRDVLFEFWLEAVYSTANYIQRARV